MRETIRFKPLVLLALLATLMMTSACKSNSAPVPIQSNSVPTKSIEKDETVATIGNLSISRQQLVDQLLSGYGSQALRTMMLSEAVNEEANSLGIRVTDNELEQELSLMKQGYDDEEQFYKAMDEQLGMNREEVREEAHYRLLLEKLSIRNVDVTPSEIDQYLEEHREEFKPSKQYQIAQIVVESKEEAQGLLNQLVDGVDFGTLAKRYSLDEFTADEGGNVGWVEEHDPFVDPGILQAVLSMKVGEVTGPIQTEEGFILVQLNGRSEEELSPKTTEEIRMDVRRQVALGKAVSLKDLEQMLLDKYNAKVLEPSLQP
jgi:foldase protein PrsA